MTESNLFQRFWAESFRQNPRMAVEQRRAFVQQVVDTVMRARPDLIEEEHVQ